MTYSITELKELDKVIGKLKERPLFYLFLSSRELFHTNFWFWLSQINNKETLSLFVDNTSNYQEIKFEREYNQNNRKVRAKVDLLISSSNNEKIVIENKVKDFPKKDQLERIQKSFANKDNPRFILTTLFWDSEFSFSGWEIKTYKEISDRINPASFTKNLYYRSIIEDYKQLTNNLAELSRLLKVNCYYDFAISYNKELYDKLNDIKIWEVYQKMRSGHLLIKYNKYSRYKKNDIMTAYAINNQKATITFELAIKNNYTIGIQIENNQFRKFVTGKKHIEFANRLKEDNLFFDSEWRSPKKRDILGYKPDFKYQYEKIDPLSFECLFNKIDKEIQSINELRREIESKIPG